MPCHSIRDMISKGIVIEHIDVTRPAVAMRRDDSGWDLARFIKKKVEEAAGSSGRTIVIRQLTIAGGSFSMARGGQAMVVLGGWRPACRSGTNPTTSRSTSLDCRSSRECGHPHSTGQRSGRAARRRPSLRRVLSPYTQTTLSVDGEVRRYRDAPVFALQIHRIRCRCRNSAS